MGSGYFSTRCGIAKILTLILGAVTIGMTAYAFDRVWKEEVFMGIIVGCFVVSVLYLIAYAFVEDLELQTTNKAFDSGFHFLAALLLLASSSLMLYSAADLRRDMEYLCSGGIDRGIPCIYDRYGNFNGFGGGGGGLPFSNGGGGVPFSHSGGDVLPSYPAEPIGPNTEYGPSGYGRMNNGLLDGRSFFGNNWLTWLKSSKAHLFEKCYEILPRLLHCNRYYELKIAAGVAGLLNGILYAITGIMVLSYS